MEALSSGRPAPRPRPRLRADEQLLARAAELIEAGWCRSALARDRHGYEVEPWAGTARAWSPFGALLCAWYEQGAGAFEVFETAYAALAHATGGPVEHWNSARWRTKRHVKSAFTRAREYLPQARRELADRVAQGA